jgi:hypothetical protein
MHSAVRQACCCTKAVCRLLLCTELHCITGILALCKSQDSANQGILLAFKLQLLQYNATTATLPEEGCSEQQPGQNSAYQGTHLAPKHQLLQYYATPVTLQGGACRK